MSDDAVKSWVNRASPRGPWTDEYMAARREELRVQREEHEEALAEDERAALARVRKLEEERAAREPIVYFIQFPGLSYVKIGTTLDLRGRLKSLQSSVPNGFLEVLATTPGGYSVESELHVRFAHLRREGEWFELRDELADYIATLGSAEEGVSPWQRG